MAVTDKYRKQHVEIAEVITRLETQISMPVATDKAKAIRETMNVMSGKLMIHLAMEDDSFYPRLAAASNAEIASMAKRYQEEMKSYKVALQTYFTTWNERAIASDVSRFSDETRQLCSLLKDRVRRENTELYALVDKYDLSVA